MQVAAVTEAAGDERSDLERVFVAHQARVFRAAYRITGNAQDAEDVLQSVFLRLARQEEGALDVANASSYLYRAQEAAEIRHWLRRALAALSPRAAEVFALRYLEGEANRDIARLLGISRVSVAVSLHRTRQRLQSELGQWKKGRR